MWEGLAAPENEPVFTPATCSGGDGPSRRSRRRRHPEELVADRAVGADAVRGHRVRPVALEARPQETVPVPRDVARLPGRPVPVGQGDRTRVRRLEAETRLGAVARSELIRPLHEEGASAAEGGTGGTPVGERVRLRVEGRHVEAHDSVAVLVGCQRADEVQTLVEARVHLGGGIGRHQIDPNGSLKRFHGLPEFPSLRCSAGANGHTVVRLCNGSVEEEEQRAACARRHEERDEGGGDERESLHRSLDGITPPEAATFPAAGR